MTLLLYRPTLILTRPTKQSCVWCLPYFALHVAYYPALLATLWLSVCSVALHLLCFVFCVCFETRPLFLLPAFQSELRHGPFYYVKQPALTTDPVDVVPQDGRNDFYCWLCHREGQVLCCELCPRVYHAKCLKLPAEPEGDWFCPECEVLACGWDRKPVVYQEDNFRTLKCMGGWGLRPDHDDRHPYFMEFTELRKILELQEILTMLV